MFLKIWNSVWPYAVAVLCFVALIIIHEFGHFIAAKSLGVRVNEFSVGFGPKIFQKKWGETNYCLCCIPFGGYCAMEGEDSTSADSRAFCNKAAWRRFIIVAMGAIFNLLLGLLLIAVILLPSSAFTTTTIDCFKEDAVSCQYGLKAGDRIIGVDGRKIYTTYDLSYAFTNIDDGMIDITVLRDGKKTELKDVRFAEQVEDDIHYLTVDFYVRGQAKTVGSMITQTFKTTVSYCVVIWRSLMDLLAGKYGISAMSGPVGVTAALGNAARQNLMNLLPILALITVNLGLFNLLPLPALDGGRLLFIFVEMITRKPVPQKWESWIHAAGFIILIAFSVLITAKDIWSLFTG